MSALYTHTTRATGTILTAAIYNTDHENHITNGDAQYLGGWSASAAQMRIQTDPGESGTESLAASISDELERLRFAIYECKQALDSSLSYWYQSPVDLAGQGRLPPWYIEGLELTVAASSPAYVEVATGTCRSADDTINMRVSSPLHRTVTALWVTAATGGGAGVTWTKFTPYHVFVIKTAASTFDIGMDTVLTASNILARASGTKYRRIGSLNTATTAGRMLACKQIKDNVIFTGQVIGNASFITNAPTGPIDTRVKVPLVPTGIRLEVDILADVTGTAIFAFGHGDIGSFLHTNETQLFGVTVLGGKGVPQRAKLWTTPSGDLRYVEGGIAGGVGARVQVLGWRDERK